MIIPPFENITAIKDAYHGGNITSAAAAVAVARLFPCLARLYPPDYDATAWLASDLDRTIGKLSSGEAECAKFVLRVYNWSQRKWKSGMFDICEAADKWGTEEKLVLVQWLADPLFL